MNELVSISEYARRNGLEKKGVQKQLDKFVANGLLPSIRDGQKRVFNPEDYERAKALSNDPAQSGRNGKPDHTGEKRSFATEKAEREAIKKEIDRFELEKLRAGHVLVKGPHGLEQAAVEIGTKIAQAIDRLADRAEEVTSSKDPKHAFRQATRKLREDIGRLMADMVDKTLP